MLIRKRNSKMCSGSPMLTAISRPQVWSTVPVQIKKTEAMASGNEDGLKMCASRPSFFQRISSFAAKPTATITNCR